MGKRKRSKARDDCRKDASGDREDGERASVKSVTTGIAIHVEGSQVAQERQLPQYAEEQAGDTPDDPHAPPRPVVALDAIAPIVDEISASVNTGNPLLKAQTDFLNTAVTADERDHFFSDAHVTPDRRAEIWSLQANLGEELVNRYSWATPDDRALRIIRHFAPIVEIGCGSNAYWCRLMKQSGIEVIGYDKSPQHGGHIHQGDDDDKTKSGKKSSKNGKRKLEDSFVVRRGGPEVLAQCQDRTLFLCYPDEEFNDLDDKDDTDGAATSMAVACLQYYKGDYIIHVGELFLDPTLSSEQAPWGRSSSPAFQERLASEFHCILRVTVPNWLHTVDRLTVWKRSSTTVIAYADEPDEANADEDDLEQVLYRHIPSEERLPVDVAAPYVAHLLNEALREEPHLALTASTTIKTETKSTPPTKSSSPKSSKRKHTSGNKSPSSPFSKKEPNEKHLVPTGIDHPPTRKETKAKTSTKSSPPKLSRRKHTTDQKSPSTSTTQEPYACPW